MKEHEEAARYLRPYVRRYANSFIHSSFIRHVISAAERRQQRRRRLLPWFTSLLRRFKR